MTLIDKTGTVSKVKPKTHVCMILDSSGSMGSIRTQAINHFNEQVDDLRKKKGHDIDVTLMTFNGDVTIQQRQQPVKAVKKLTSKSYKPNGSTALYDAIGYSIGELQTRCDDLEDENTAVLFLIITDGHENSSQEFSQASVRGLISSLEKKGWTFTFMAANVDPMSIQQDFGVAGQNVAIFHASAAGMANATSRSVGASKGYFNSRSLGVRSVDAFYDGAQEDDSKSKNLVDSEA
jgi:uncharacterized protein YegL